MIDLIIKPTQSCNFKCDFCSSSNISLDNSSKLPLEKIYDFIDNNKVNTIIVNGGDPLMMPPNYYKQLLDHIEKFFPETTLSFTTNLWNFYIAPDKWLDIFTNKNVYVTTSFQYGGERKLSNGTEFSEELFTKVISKFNSLVGYMPMFISVITKKNENDMLKTVKLAKKLGTTCKINPAIKSGRCNYTYPLYKSISKYIEIIEAGLGEYEYNSNILKKIINGEHTTCPFNRDCLTTIRCMGPNGELFTCGSLHDIYLDNIGKGYDLSKYSEKELLKDYSVLKNECFACDLFKLCNGCYRHIMEIKDNNMIKTHCEEMNKLKRKLTAL